MEFDTKNPTHDQIWDDSALVDSWNSALAEYQVRLSPLLPSCVHSCKTNRKNPRNTTASTRKAAQSQIF